MAHPSFSRWLMLSVLVAGPAIAQPQQRGPAAEAGVVTAPAPKVTPSAACADVQVSPGTCAGEGARQCLEEGLARVHSEQKEERCRAQAAITAACKEGGLKEACEMDHKAFRMPQFRPDFYARFSRAFRARGLTSAKGVYSCWVTERGEVQDCEVLEAGTPVFDALALEMLKAERLQPATRYGKPTAFRNVFTLQNQSH